MGYVSQLLMQVAPHSYFNIMGIQKSEMTEDLSLTVEVLCVMVRCGLYSTSAMICNLLYSFHIQMWCFHQVILCSLRLFFVYVFSNQIRRVIVLLVLFSCAVCFDLGNLSLYGMEGMVFRKVLACLKSYHEISVFRHGVEKLSSYCFCFCKWLAEFIFSTSFGLILAVSLS